MLLVHGRLTTATGLKEDSLYALTTLGRHPFLLGRLPNQLNPLVLPLLSILLFYGE